MGGGGGEIRKKKLKIILISRKRDGAVCGRSNPDEALFSVATKHSAPENATERTLPSAMACDKKWLPLESNPDVMNKFLSQVGVPDDFTLLDVIDLDDEPHYNLPTKVKAVLLLFPTGEQHEAFVASEQESIESEGQVVSDRVYFMKVDANNASGTVSLIHAVANADEEMQLGGESTLKEFLERTADMSPEERGQELEMDENLCSVHESLSKEGQTEAPAPDEETNLHFITFVSVDEQLYELDARKNFPINHGSTSMETLLKLIIVEMGQYYHPIKLVKSRWTTPFNCKMYENNNDRKATVLQAETTTLQ
ncbi:hypothetical protein JTE90_015511 [Oedothorax gibbosus]|uniref:Ubiquitin carboxyl-terminal hydrolase n=1 Tax=Oedothorax gibbosus TaxID=931172 RepID=A0AAV6VSN4_9ARAC|nr:hypothetical protein JTE90_015511 [Oedothorax gibbosus]